MKILLINKFYYLKGGSERVFFDTKKVLEQNGHDVVVFAMHDEKNLQSKYSKYFVKNQDFTSAKNILKAAGNLYSFDTQKKLEALIKETKPDIAHLHNAYNQISPSIFKVLKKHNIPVVLTAHDYHLICPNYKLFTKGKPCQRCKKHKFYNAVINKCQNQSYIQSLFAAGVMYFNTLFRFYKNGIDHIITPSNFLKKILIQWGYNKDKITNIPNAIETGDFKDFTPSQERKYLLYLGRFSKEKGIPVLLKALKNMPEVHIKLMGAGPLEKEVKDLCKELPNAQVIPFTNDKKVIIDMINGAQATIIPSIWYENYPMSVLESFACGTPVIGAKIGGIPELVIDGKTGYTFEPNNEKGLQEKIKNIYNNYRQIEKLGNNAKTLVKENNSLDMYYNRLMEVYTLVISNK